MTTSNLWCVGQIGEHENKLCFLLQGSVRRSQDWSSCVRRIRVSSWDPGTSTCGWWAILHHLHPVKVNSQLSFCGRLQIIFYWNSGIVLTNSVPIVPWTIMIPIHPMKKIVVTIILLVKRYGVCICTRRAPIIKQIPNHSKLASLGCFLWILKACSYVPSKSLFLHHLKNGISAVLCCCLHIVLKIPKVSLTKAATLTFRANGPLEYKISHSHFLSVNRPLFWLFCRRRS